METVTIITTLVGAIGGWEAVRWLINHKSNRRIAEAGAEKVEIDKERDEFYFLRERLQFKDEELLAKEKRFEEQTQLVRSLNKQLLEKTFENGNLQVRIASLEAERKMKLCEVRGCPKRQPQSGY